MVKAFSLLAGIVLERDVDPLDALAFVLFLLVLEHVLVEVKLQVFVAEVDAHLLKTETNDANKINETPDY